MLLALVLLITVHSQTCSDFLVEPKYVSINYILKPHFNTSDGTYIYQEVSNASGIQGLCSLTKII